MDHDPKETIRPKRVVIKILSIPAASLLGNISIIVFGTTFRTIVKTLFPRAGLEDIPNFPFSFPCRPGPPVSDCAFDWAAMFICGCLIACLILAFSMRKVFAFIIRNAMIGGAICGLLCLPLGIFLFWISRSGLHGFAGSLQEAFSVFNEPFFEMGFIIMGVYGLMLGVGEGFCLWLLYFRSPGNAKET